MKNTSPSPVIDFWITTIISFINNHFANGNIRPMTSHSKNDMLVNIVALGTIPVKICTYICYRVQTVFFAVFVRLVFWCSQGTWKGNIREHSFGTHAKSPEKTNISYSLIPTRTCANQEVIRTFCVRTKWIIPKGTLARNGLIRKDVLTLSLLFFLTNWMAIALLNCDSSRLNKTL